MTKCLRAQDLAKFFPNEIDFNPSSVREDEAYVACDQLFEACRLLKETPGLDMDYLVSITGVDYIENFEVIYHLLSLSNNHSFVLKVNVFDRESPTVSSLTDLWMGARLQEREVWDLMGITFTGHGNLKRILTWEGFDGHPLRRDYLGG